MSPISGEEVFLAAQDMPLDKAAGPDQIPSAIYGYLPSLHRALSMLCACMPQENEIPATPCRYYLQPFDKAGEGPGQCASKRPISILIACVKMLESVLRVD